MLLTVLISFASACKAPPPAPEGLDDSTKFLYREFYGDDDTIGAGLTGFMNWYDEDGDELLGQTASLDSTGAFSLQNLTESDIDHLPVAGDGRDLTLASGVVALAEMDCSWDEAEALLVRSDQDVVFKGDFDTYDRTYITSRPLFEDATDGLDFAAIKEPLDVFSDGFEIGDLGSSVLMTSNDAQSTELGVQIQFGIELNLRHGIYDIQGVPTEAMLIETFLPERAEGKNGTNSMEQSYSVEINIARPGGKTLRMLANWVQLESPLVASDSPAVLATAVNKAQDAATRLSKICAGDIEIDSE